MATVQLQDSSGGQVGAPIRIKDTNELSPEIEVGIVVAHATDMNFRELVGWWNQYKGTYDRTFSTLGSTEKGHKDGWDNHIQTDRNRKDIVDYPICAIFRKEYGRQLKGTKIQRLGNFSVADMDSLYEATVYDTSSYRLYQLQNRLMVEAVTGRIHYVSQALTNIELPLDYRFTEPVFDPEQRVDFLGKNKVYFLKFDIQVYHKTGYSKQFKSYNGIKLNVGLNEDNILFTDTKTFNDN